MIRRLEQIEEELAAATDDAGRVALLNELAFALSRVDPQKGLMHAAESEQIASELDDPRAEAESLRAAAFCHETLSDYQTAMSCARRGRGLFRKSRDRTGEGNCLIAIGVIAHATTDFTTALDALHEALDIFREGDNRPRMASAYNNIGMIYQELGDFSRSLEAYLEALRINEALGETSLAAVNISNVSNIYYYLGDYERSFEYDCRALDVARQLNDVYSIAHRLESISSNYKERGEYDAALDALNEALEIFRQMQEKRREAAALIKFGTLYELLNEPKLALAGFQQAAKIATAIGKRDLLVTAQLRIGMLHSGQRSHKRAIPVLQQGLTNAREAALLKSESDLLLALADALDAIGEYAQASAHRKEHAVLLGKLYGEDRQRAVAEMQARFDVERAEGEREVFRLKNEHLEEMMELRSKELTSMAMRLVQKNAFLQKLRKDTIQLEEEHPASKKVLDMLLRAIAGNLHGDDEWGRFEQEFQQVHTDFLRRLAADYPKLTPAELKVCALLKVNLSNKEIANLLSVSVRNVESHRYSIRKKMLLPSDTNLAAYLTGL